jgi:hypothetical protein
MRFSRVCGISRRLWTLADLIFAEDVMLKLLSVRGCVCGRGGLGACSEGRAEKGGEKIDAAIDKATGQKDKDPVDAIHDATDGDKSTKPN